MSRNARLFMGYKPNTKTRQGRFIPYPAFFIFPPECE